MRNQIREKIRHDVVQTTNTLTSYWVGLFKDLESQDKMGNFEIQQLISDSNQAETLAKNIAEKAACVADSIIQKIRSGYGPTTPKDSPLYAIEA